VELGRAAVTGRRAGGRRYKGRLRRPAARVPDRGVIRGVSGRASRSRSTAQPTGRFSGDAQLLRALPARIMIAFNDLAKEAEAVLPREVLGLTSCRRSIGTCSRRQKGCSRSSRSPNVQGGSSPGLPRTVRGALRRAASSGLGRSWSGRGRSPCSCATPSLMCLDTIDGPAVRPELMRFATEYAKQVGDAVLTTRIGLSYSRPDRVVLARGSDTYREVHQAYHQELVNYFRAKKVGTTVTSAGHASDPRGPGRRRLRRDHHRTSISRPTRR